MVLKINDFIYDDATGVISKNNQQHKLTKLQKKLLDYFIACPNQVLSKEILMQEVWGRVVTDNTINKFISALRGYLEENPAVPQIIVTHFGHGISFEGAIRHVKESDEKTGNKFLIIAIVSLIVFLLIIVIYKFTSNNFVPKQNTSIDLSQSKHVLILPTDYRNIDLDQVQEQGLNELLKTIYNREDSEGNVVFNPAKLNNRQSIEKYWHVDNELLVLQSKVIKNGDIYESVIQLSKGAKVLAESKISSPDLGELLKNQISQLSHFQAENTQQRDFFNDAYIRALGFKKSGDLEQAKGLLEQIISDNENNYQARFELALVQMEQKDYTRSLAQLETLRVTKAYEKMSAQIELSIAQIRYFQHDYEKLINDLKQYQASHLQISDVKKSKIKLQIADAYLALNDFPNAMKFYHQSLSMIDENFNPDLFAKILYGQAMIQLNNSNDETVYQLFEKTLSYATAAGDYEYQVLALDEMAKMHLVSNEWEKGIALKKQAIEIMELINDKGKVAQGLGTLAAFLIQTGHFTEAKKINDRLGKIAKEIDSDSLYLNYLHYDAVLLLNVFKFERAKQQIDKQLDLATKTKNIGMQLDNAFLEFELRLAKKDVKDFKQEWDKRTQMIKDSGLERYQVYMDLYLARYYKQVSKIEQAETTIAKISEMAESNNDIKILVDAQNQLAELYLEIDPKKSLEILQAIEQYKPDANPYLELKALALNKLGKNIEAFNLLNQAKLLFHEAWKSENQILLEQLQQQLR